MTRIVGVLLAAGAGRRFGAAKLLHPLPHGTPVGLAAARSLIQALPEALAVVRPGDSTLSTALAACGLRVIENPAAEQGMGGSLAAGIAAAPDADGWLIALADMPWVRPATIRSLAEALRDGASMVAPVCDGRRGHPVGFASQWGSRLCDLSGDQGARALLTDHAAQLVLRPTNDRGVLYDIDHPADLSPRDTADDPGGLV